MEKHVIKKDNATSALNKVGGVLINFQNKLCIFNITRLLYWSLADKAGIYKYKLGKIIS